MASLSLPRQSESTARSSGGMVSPKQTPSQEDGAACEPIQGLLHSVIEQLRGNNRIIPVVVVPIWPFTLPMCPGKRRLSLPSDNPAQLAEILARQQASAPTAARYVTVANDPDPPVPARDIPRTAASTTALVDGHPPIGQPNTPRTAQPSNVPQEQSIFREDITPSSPTESWAPWSALRDWDPPPRSYH